MRKFSNLFMATAMGVFLFGSSSSFSQNRDSLLALFPTMKDEMQKLHTIFFILRDNNDLQETRRHQEKLKEIAKKQKDKLAESFCTMGYYIGIAGNISEGTKILFEALRVAEDEKSDVAIGIHNLGIGNLYTDPARKKYFYKIAIDASSRSKDSMFLAVEYINLAYVYLGERKLDSALYYNQLASAIANARDVPDPSGLRQAGSIQYQFKRNELALQYWYSAKEEYKKIIKFTGKIVAVPSDVSLVYASLSRFFLREGKYDSALHYARLEADLHRNSLIMYQITPAFDLWHAYEKINSDSALKYITQYTTLKDSVYNLNRVKEAEALAIVENERQLRLKTERKNNLQYAGIGIGVLVLIILFLLLSHSIVANQNFIRFLGVIALLIVFEFLNLLLHPYLDKWTNHSPVLMLLIMVGIAALLVPVHHRLEKWIVHRLVEKNRRIRLDSAKRTIEKLEKE